MKYNIDQYGLRNSDVEAVERPVRDGVGGMYRPLTHQAYVPAGDTMYERGLRLHEAGHSRWQGLDKVRLDLPDQLIEDLYVHTHLPGGMPESARRDELMLVAKDARHARRVKASLESGGADDSQVVINIISSVRSIGIIEREERGRPSVRVSHQRTIDTLNAITGHGPDKARAIVDAVRKGDLRKARKLILDLIKDGIAKQRCKMDPETEEAKGEIRKNGEDKVNASHGTNGGGDESGDLESAGRTSFDGSVTTGKTDGKSKDKDDPDTDIKRAVSEATNIDNRNKRENIRRVKRISNSMEEDYNIKIASLENPVPRNIDLGHGASEYAASESGIRIKAHRLAECISPCPPYIFKARRNGGTVLLDMSESMNWTIDKIEAILKNIPEATIAGYAAKSDSYGNGKLAILASRGYRVREVPWIGIGNYVDALAMEWLERQPQPHYYVCDLGFTGHIEECNAMHAKLTKRGMKTFSNYRQLMAFISKQKGGL